MATLEVVEWLGGIELEELDVEVVEVVIAELLDVTLAAELLDVMLAAELLDVVLTAVVVVGVVVGPELVDVAVKE